MAIPFKSSIVLGQIFAQNDDWRVLCGGNTELYIKKDNNKTTTINLGYIESSTGYPCDVAISGGHYNQSGNVLVNSTGITLTHTKNIDVTAQSTATFRGNDSTIFGMNNSSTTSNIYGGTIQIGSSQTSKIKLGGANWNGSVQIGNYPVVSVRHFTESQIEPYIEESRYNSQWIFDILKMIGHTSDWENIIVGGFFNIKLELNFTIYNQVYADQSSAKTESSELIYQTIYFGSYDHTKIASDDMGSYPGPNYVIGRKYGSAVTPNSDGALSNFSLNCRWVDAQNYNYPQFFMPVTADQIQWDANGKSYMYRSDTYQGVLNIQNCTIFIAKAEN